MRGYKQVPIEVCDQCKEREAEPRPCVACKTYLCRSCLSEGGGEQFQGGVMHSIPVADSIICGGCINKAELAPLVTSYNLLRRLYNEFSTFRQRFETRKLQAEERVLSCLDRFRETGTATHAEVTYAPVEETIQVQEQPGSDEEG